MLLGLAQTLLASAAPPADLDLSISGLRSARGLVRICLTRDPDHFPGCSNDAQAIKRSVPAGHTALRFDDLPSGAWAVSLFHDENRNGKLDTVLGIPREGFGFSRNPPIRFGPPRFSAARFSLTSGETSQSVRLKYLL
ncbi:DUF2141 domain-containing protein [Sphingomonas tabacisoli]|uniref:DUF2141 domain-containing protein n=1 Tax=Sphingomonas tabacisoli TaxID=2249466 RepID=A0ABW4HZM9_9SPHN